MNSYRKLILIATGCTAVSLFFPSFMIQLPHFHRGKAILDGRGDSWLLLLVILLPGLFVGIGKRELPPSRWATAGTMLIAALLLVPMTGIAFHPLFKPLFGLYLQLILLAALFILGALAWYRPKIQMAQ